MTKTANKTKKALLNLMVGLGLLSMTACGGGGGGAAVVIFYPAWYDVFGYYCGSGDPRPGCNFYSDGTKVVDAEDPFYSSFNVLQHKTWFYTDSYGFPAAYTGWAWKSSTGIIYTDFGRALNSPQVESTDMIGDVAAEEQGAIEGAGQMFAEKYSLSAETGRHVAQVLHDAATLGKDRARTEEDIADFTQRLYGIDYNKVKSAVEVAQKGDMSKLNSVIDQVAINWSASPETTKEILKSWYGKQLGL